MNSLLFILLIDASYLDAIDEYGNFTYESASR